MIDPLRQRARPFSLLLLAAFSVGCGGASVTENANDQGGAANGGRDEHAAGAGGSAAASGHGGASAGSAGGAGTPAAGAGGSAGESAGAAGMGENAGSLGGIGGAGDGGGAGLAQAGSSGSSSVCHATPPQPCGGGLITLSRSCVSDAMASPGTSLPLATCRVMCESMFTFTCTVSAVQQTTIGVQCTTGCPASQP